MKFLNNRSRHSRSAHRRHTHAVRDITLTAVVMLILIVGTAIWQRRNHHPPVVQAISESAAADELLPLADPVRPLTGGHDMEIIPARPPQPWTVEEGTPVPKVDLPQATFDFGEIPPDPPVSYIFAIQNTGDADLHLSNLVTSCGCTVAELSTSVIPPGQRADLRVDFDPDYHETVGPVTRVVWLISDDPSQPWVELAITADVQPAS